MIRSVPVIGITADGCDGSSEKGRPDSEPNVFLPRRYLEAVGAAGGVPVILAPSANGSRLHRLVDRLDGLLISGGDFDIPPRLYGEKAIGALGKVKPERTRFELELTKLALARDMPILGICGGAQAINVALGGSLYQDIAAQKRGAGEHQQGARKELGGHPIQIAPGTRLGAILKRRRLEVNTTHHQAVKALGRGLIVNAVADDGVIEGIESRRHSFVLGVQWHPEVLACRRAHQRRIFSVFISMCARFLRRM